MLKIYGACDINLMGDKNSAQKVYRRARRLLSDVFPITTKHEFLMVIDHVEGSESLSHVWQEDFRRKVLSFLGV
jgi:hypothetical protein